ncbi:sulfatase-like hydrolase/transferase [Cryomorpha ignava]|uniref:Sulfatase-like hydrolase/transferase n=1 Tax=Cryomorpha ignava TaxID=101383 RepID=A0A7K3WP60_9FLAO|nr:phosphoethanolamine transferase [Cryomorpha ignava]NEN23440.1 sulfatase-like hydrolase/transferase [Cryomorpha ignava]
MNDPKSLESHVGIKHTLLSLFPPFILALIFFPLFAGLYFNYRLVEFAEPVITLSFITILIILRYLSGKNIFYFLAAILSFINGFILLSHWIMLKGPMTSNSLYVALNTNYDEAVGFLHLKSGYEFLLIIPYIILFLLALIYTFNYPRKQDKKHTYILIATVLLILVFLSTRVYEGGFRYGTPELVRSSILFYKDATAFKKLKSERQKRSAEIDAKLIAPNNPAVVVLIEGESTNRNHMSLYGYYRDTSPLLKQAEDIIVYTDVVSGYHSTMTSITGALTESNLENKRKSYECFNIMDVCRASGVKSYWLSNQSPIGFLDNIITILAQQSDKQEFLNLTSGLSLSKNEKPSYDSVLFSALEKTLREEGDQKFIVLHLLGSHGRYIHRYPSEYKRFSGSTKKEKVIAQYDNSVLYNDFVVDSILKILRTYAEVSNTPTAAIYLSDHGENVYDDADYAGHDYSVILYPSIVEIPYVVWLSEEYQNTYPDKSAVIRSHRDMPYITDDNFHSLIDLLNIETSVLDAKRSVFNENYNDKRRRVMADGREYPPHSREE